MLGPVWPRSAPTFEVDCDDFEVRMICGVEGFQGLQGVRHAFFINMVMGMVGNFEVANVRQPAEVK